MDKSVVCLSFLLGSVEEGSLLAMFWYHWLMGFVVITIMDGVERRRNATLHPHDNL